MCSHVLACAHMCLLGVCVCVSTWAHVFLQAAIPVEESVCVAALRQGAGDEMLWLPTALHRVATQLSARVGPGGRPPVGQHAPAKHAPAKHAPATGSVEELVHAVEEARQVLGKRIVVVIDGLLFNEAVYLSTRLAELCQPGGALCRKAFFAMSCNMPGPDESLVTHMDSSWNAAPYADMVPGSAVEWGGALANPAHLAPLHSHRGCYLSSRIHGHMGAVRGIKAGRSSGAGDAASLPSRTASRQSTPAPPCVHSAAGKGSRPSTAGTRASTAASRPSTARSFASHLGRGEDRRDRSAWYTGGRPSSHYRCASFIHVAFATPLTPVYKRVWVMRWLYRCAWHARPTHIDPAAFTHACWRRVRSPRRRDDGRAAVEMALASASIGSLPASRTPPPCLFCMPVWLASASFGQ